jgi:hypothetical protein
VLFPIIHRPAVSALDIGHHSPSTQLASDPDVQVLTFTHPVCYGSQLSRSPRTVDGAVLKYILLGTTFGGICHELYASQEVVFFLTLLVVFFTGASSLSAQDYRPDLPPPPGLVQPSTNPNQPFRLPRPGAPALDEYKFQSLCVEGTPECHQEHEGSMIHLRGPHYIETTEMQLWADEID